MIDDKYGIVTRNILQRRQVGPITDAELPDRPTVAEIARWLRRHPSVVYRWAKAGLIPSKKVGRVYVFSKARLLEWAESEEAA